MEPIRSEKIKPEIVMLDLQEIAKSAFAEIFNSMSDGCDPNRRCEPDGCSPTGIGIFNDLNSIINPSCIVLDGKAISLDQISAPQFTAILKTVIAATAKPLIMENKMQSTLVSVLTARVQALESQLSKRDK